jgi:hypothetical protein
MEPQIITSIDNFPNTIAMDVFKNACAQWNYLNNNFKYDITTENVFFEFGQDWKYTSFITTDVESESEDEKSWQSLCPRDWELVVTETDINRIIEMAFFYMDNLQKPPYQRMDLFQKFDKEKDA